jgi:flagellar basal-body rod protein FlgB
MSNINPTRALAKPDALAAKPADALPGKDVIATPAFAAAFALAQNKQVSHHAAMPAHAAGKTPNFIPLRGKAMGDHNINERALGLHAYRLQLLASNIANADTPGYKAVDIDVQQALRNGLSADSVIPLQYHVPSQDSADGNTVEMDVERTKFAKSALMYEYTADRVKGHYKMMEELFKNLP